MTTILKQMVSVVQRLAQFVDFLKILLYHITRLDKSKEIFMDKKKEEFTIAEQLLFFKQPITERK